MFTIDQLQTDVFGPVSLSLKPGEALIVRGASGAGKTRFLRALADLDPSQGKVWLKGEERFSSAATDWRAKVRYAPAVSAWWHETVAPHFKTLTSLSEGMEQLKLPARLLESPVADLSTGERQRLAFLRAVQDQPDVLLLDEPTSALDEPSIARVEAMMDEELARGACLLIVSHRPEQMEKYGQRQLIFDKGQAELIESQRRG